MRAKVRDKGEEWKSKNKYKEKKREVIWEAGLQYTGITIHPEQWSENAGGLIES